MTADSIARRVGARLLARRLVQSGPVIDLELCDLELPNGQRVTLQIARHPGASAVCALSAAAIRLGQLR